MFKSAGLDVQSAGKLVDKILDWRDANPAKRLNGAKERGYRMSGHPYRPRNGAFQSVHELDPADRQSRSALLGPELDEQMSAWNRDVPTDRNGYESDFILTTNRG